MPTYTFLCKNDGVSEFDKDFLFKEFDQIKGGSLKVLCECCGNCNPEMVMGGINLYIYDATPRTLGSLADRNTKYRLPQVEEAEDIKREKDIKAGKKVAPKEINVPWDAPERPKVDMKERKEKRKEAHARKLSKRPTRSPSNGRR